MTYNKKWIQVFAIWISVIVPYCARGQDAAATAPATTDPVAETPQITLGAKVGVSLNQFSQPGTAMGISLGAFGKYHVLDFLDARLELLYSTQGGGRSSYTRYSDDGLYGSFGSAGSSTSGNGVGVSSMTSVNPYITFNTIEIPVLAELGLPEFNGMNIQPKLILGGSYSGVMSSIEHRTQRYNFNDGTSVDVGYRRETVTDNYAKSQWAVIAGLGMNYNLGKRVFHMEVRYRQGLTQLNQQTCTRTAGGKLYSSSVTFNFGMTLFNF